MQTGTKLSRPAEAESTAAPSREAEYALIERILQGEKELFYQLVRPYERRVYVMAFAVLRNEADAQDASQDALFKAFKHLSQFRSEARFSTWLIQVTLNEARMRLRKNHLEIMRPIDEIEQDDGSYTPRDFTDWREIPSEALERKQVREMLVKALASLAEKYREVFVLRDVQHMSTEEAAEVLGISPGAVKTRLLRARLMLRDFLAPGLNGAWASPSTLPKGTKPWS
ncbi:MAG TPA: sigma-70 family RNA polymerase sigma factor [Candidatus Acidoferrales bacterium]